MTTQDATERTVPGWITPGVRVLVCTRGVGGDLRSVTKTQIAKVATRSFTIDGSKQRFPIADRPAVQEGGPWGWMVHVVPADSDEAREIRQVVRRRRLEAEARAACERWAGDRTGENRLAAITALQAVED